MRTKNYLKKHLQIAKKGLRLLRLYNATIFPNSSLDRDRFLIENVDALMIQQSSLENVSFAHWKRSLGRVFVRQMIIFGVLRQLWPWSSMYNVKMGLNTLRRVVCWLWSNWFWVKALILWKAGKFQCKVENQIKVINCRFSASQSVFCHSQSSMSK